MKALFDIVTMRIQQTGQSFNGIHIASANAKVNGSVANYDLYKLTQNDSAFIENLANSINLPELWHGMKKTGYLFWAKAVNSFLSLAKNKEMESILITKDKIPCGGINYQKKNNSYEIGYRVTWPIELDKKAPFAGTILYLNLFKKALNENIDTIRTIATRIGPFDVVGKCYRLGFSSRGGDEYNEIMSIRNAEIAKTIERYKQKVSINTVENNSDENLLSILKLKL